MATPKKSKFEQSLNLIPVLLQESAEFWESQIPKQLFQLASKKKSAATQRYLFLGTGSSCHVAQWASWLFRSHHFNAAFYSSWDALNGAIEYTKEDVVFVISHRGYRSLTKHLVDHLPSRRVILVSGAESPSGSWPSITCSPAEVSQAHSVSLVGAMCAISEFLATLLNAHDRSTLRSYRIETGIHLQDLQDQEQFSDLPRLKSNHQLYFVGGGPFEAIAREAALKAKEMAHIPSHFVNTEEMLHGPLAAVSAGDHIHILAPTLGSKPSKLLINSVENHFAPLRYKNCFEALSQLKALTMRPKFPPHLPWVWQAVLALGYSQRVCLQYSLQRKTNPDTNRQEDPSYSKAFKQAKF